MSASLVKLSVEQFHGIELGEFPARIAEVALWMMDHIMNVRLSLLFGRPHASIPLKQSPHIVHADALELDWESVLPAAKCSYVMGNPPFRGAKMQSEEAARAGAADRGPRRLGRHAGLCRGLVHQGGRNISPPPIPGLRRKPPVRDP